jgi:hypothetical protein
MASRRVRTKGSRDWEKGLKCVSFKEVIQERKVEVRSSLDVQYCQSISQHSREYWAVAVKDKASPSGV